MGPRGLSETELQHQASLWSFSVCLGFVVVVVVVFETRSQK